MVVGDGGGFCGEGVVGVRCAGWGVCVGLCVGGGGGLSMVAVGVCGVVIVAVVVVVAVGVGGV